MRAASWAAIAMALRSGVAGVDPVPSLELHSLPFLRDCNESTHVRPIDAFCRKAFRPEDLFVGGPQPLTFSIDALRTIPVQQGALSHVRVEGLLRSSLPGLWFDAFLTGPALLRANVLERRRGEYEIWARAFDPGEYSLEVTLMWENRTFAFSPVLGPEPNVRSAIVLHTAENARDRHDVPLCRPLRMANATGLPPFRVAGVNVSAIPAASRPLPLCAPYGSPRYDAGERADWGRWVNLSHPETRRTFALLSAAPTDGANDTAGVPRHGRRLQAAPAGGCDLAWAPSGCALRRYGPAELDSCVDSGVRLMLYGDSNMREPFAALSAASAKVRKLWKYVGAFGVFIPGNVAQRRWSHRNEGLLAALRGGGNATHCIFTYGAWDVQRQPASHALADWTFLLGKIHSVLAAPAQAGAAEQTPTVVWRTTVSASSRMDRAPGTDKRTNAKIAWLTGRQKEYLAMMARTGMLPPRARIHVHDSFAITAPRFHDSTDTHHYFHTSPSRGRDPVACGAKVGTPSDWLADSHNQSACPFGTEFANAVGVSDVMVMLNSVCNQP